MDVKVWTQCFARYMMAMNDPERVADLMDYMTNIIRASQDFESLEWVTCDDETSLQDRQPITMRIYGSA